MSSESPPLPGPASDPVAVVERHLAAGCSVHSGHLGTKDVTVLITPYCHERLSQRDLLPAEVLQILQQPPSLHAAGKTPGRREVLGQVGQRTIRVVYEPVEREIVKVITAYQE